MSNSGSHLRKREGSSAAVFLSLLREGTASYPKRRKYLVGVSGGADSCALLHGLHEIGFSRLVVCHLNHQLRGTEADRDAAFVGRLARRLGYVLDEGEADVRSHAASRKLSLETAARELRLSFFLQCSRAHRCTRLFLAHHADDQIETCLFNFLRGTGVSGLAGMKPVSKITQFEILRPMLGIRRRHIHAFVTALGIRYREDASNSEPKHTRNRLRHEIIPGIETIFGTAWTDAVLRTAEILRAEDAWMASLVPELGDTVPCKALLKMPLGLRRRTVLRWLRTLGVPDAGFSETERVLSILDPQSSPAKVNLPAGIHCRRRKGELFLERKVK